MSNEGPQIKDDIGGDGFDPRSARAVVSNGNLVMVTWGTDGAAGENGAWYSYNHLDTPEFVSQPLPLPTPYPDKSSITENQGTTNTTITDTHQIVNTQVISGETIQKDSNFLQNPQFSIFIGILPVAIFLAAFIIFRFTPITKNH